MSFFINIIILTRLYSNFRISKGYCNLYLLVNCKYLQYTHRPTHFLRPFRKLSSLTDLYCPSIKRGQTIVYNDVFVGPIIINQPYFFYIKCCIRFLSLFTFCCGFICLNMFKNCRYIYLFIDAIITFIVISCIFSNFNNTSNKDDTYRTN